MGFKFTSIGAMTLCVAANMAFAETTPGRGAHDARVRVAQYQDGQVYRIVTGMTHVTSVEFAEGETIRSILAGDTEGFMFDGVPGGRAFAIKPVARGVQTNITVYTNLRSYYFNVVESSEAAHFVVRFTYPGETASRPTGAVAGQAPNYRYGASERLEFTPSEIWDDGTFTYFRFAPNAALPVIMRWSDGNERVVNSTTQTDGVIRVSGVSPRWVLRRGDEEVCIQEMEAAGSGS